MKSLCLAIVIGSLACVDAAHGCGVCIAFQGNPLALPHPRAIEIAVATRRALDRGLLRASYDDASTGWHKRSKLDGPALVRAWLATLAGESVQAPCTVHVVLIDTGQTFAIHVRGGNAVFETPRGAADAVLATSAASLHALVARRLTVDQALQDGLLIVDGDTAIARRLASVTRRR